MSTLAKELEHLKNHVTYPADRNGVLSACNAMMDVPQDDKDWLSRTLPEGQYHGPDEVLKAVLKRL